MIINDCIGIEFYGAMPIIIQHLDYGVPFVSKSKKSRCYEIELTL